MTWRNISRQSGMGSVPQGLPEVMLFLPDGSASRCHWDDTAVTGRHGGRRWPSCRAPRGPERKIVRIIPVDGCLGVGIASPKGSRSDELPRRGVGKAQRRGPPRISRLSGDETWIVESSLMKCARQRRISDSRHGESRTRSLGRARRSQVWARRTAGSSRDHSDLRRVEELPPARAAALPGRTPALRDAGQHRQGEDDHAERDVVEPRDDLAEGEVAPPPGRDQPGRTGSARRRSSEAR